MSAPFALFGITNDGVNLVISMLFFFLFVVWLALVYYTYSDARRRLDDPLLVGCATAASLFPYVGTIVYTIVRPPEFLEDKRERELEIRAAEARLQGLNDSQCPYCNFHVERSFLICPNCQRRLKEPCKSCGKPIDPNWKSCPYCEAEVPGAAREPSRRQRGQRQAEPRGERPARRAERPAEEGKRPARQAERPASEGKRRSGKRPQTDRPRQPRPASERPPQRPPESPQPLRSPERPAKRPPSEGAPRPQQPPPQQGQPGPQQPDDGDGHGRPAPEEPAEAPRRSAG